MKMLLKPYFVTFVLSIACFQTVSVFAEIKSVQASLFHGGNVEVVGAPHSHNLEIAIISDVLFSSDYTDSEKKEIFLQLGDPRQGVQLTEIMHSYDYIQNRVLESNISWLGVENSSLHLESQLNLLEVVVFRLNLDISKNIRAKRAMVYLMGPILYLKLVEANVNPNIGRALQQVHILPLESASARKKFEAASTEYDKNLKAISSVPIDILHSLESLIRLFDNLGKEISKEQIEASSKRVDKVYRNIVKKFLYSYKNRQAAMNLRDKKMAKSVVRASKKYNGNGLVLVGSRHLTGLPEKISNESENYKESYLRKFLHRIKSFTNRGARCSNLFGS